MVKWRIFLALAVFGALPACNDNDGQLTVNKGTPFSGSPGPSPTVAVVPPSNLSYPLSTASYMVGVAISSLSPTVGGGVATSYSVSPSLPAGLALDASSGILSGTPGVASSAQDYTVSAANAGGSTTFILHLTVTPPPVLAHVDSSQTLILHSGPNASLRLYGEVSDGDESFILRHAVGDPSDTVTVQALGFTQKYAGVSYVYGHGGNGNNSILIKKDSVYCNGVSGALCYDSLMGDIRAHLVGGGNGTNTLQVATGGINIMEGGPADSMIGGVGSDTYIINIPEGFNGSASGTLTPGLGSDALVVRPDSGKAYLHVSQDAGTRVLHFDNYTTAGMSILKSALTVTVPPGITRWVVAAADGSENAITVDTSVSRMDIVGGLHSTSDVLSNGNGTNFVLFLAASTTFNNTDPTSCATASAPRPAGCTLNAYFGGALGTFAINNQSSFDLVYANSNASPYYASAYPGLCPAAVGSGDTSLLCLQ